MNTTSSSISDKWKDSTVEFGENLRKVETQLENIWIKIGLNNEMIGNRVNTVFAVLNEVLDKMTLEEQNLLETLRSKVVLYRDKVKALYNDLHLEYQDLIHSDSLLVQEYKLRDLCCDLENQKRKSMNEWKQIIEVHKKLCQRLDIPTNEIEIKGIPNTTQIYQMLEINETHDKELKAREARFLVFKSSIIDMVNSMEYNVKDEFLKSIIEPNCESVFIFSKQNMNKVSSIKDKLESELKEIKTKICKLMSSAEFLWSLLSTDQNYVNTFKINNQKYTTKVLDNLKNEVNNLHKIRLNSLSEYIPKLKEKLTLAWNKNRYGPSKIEQFIRIYGDKISEEAVTAHEDALVSAHEYYKTNESILQLIEKRDEVFENFRKFETLQTNPEKFNNRGGSLLKEEKLRKSVYRDLPKLEAQILDLVKKWETDNSIPFTIDDMPVGDYFKSQYDSLRNEKEERKKMRMIVRGPTSTPGKNSVNTTFGTPRINSTFIRNKTPGTDITNRSRRIPNIAPLTPIKRRSSLLWPECNNVFPSKLSGSSRRSKCSSNDKKLSSPPILNDVFTLNKKSKNINQSQTNYFDSIHNL